MSQFMQDRTGIPENNSFHTKQLKTTVDGAASSLDIRPGQRRSFWLPLLVLAVKTGQNTMR
ncbi:hypothetical protein GCM10027347_57620 [Larkinella harenae]